MIAAVALLLTQCRKPAVELPTAGPANENMVSMTVTVGHGGKTEITGTGAITWSAGDKLYVGDGSKYIGCLELQSGAGDATGTFSGSVSATESTDFGFYYLGRKDYTSRLIGGTSTLIDISFAEQDGRIEKLSDCHIGYGTATGRVDGGSILIDDVVAMTSKVAMAYFDFKDGTAEGYTGAITLNGTNICNSMTVGFNGSFAGTTDTEGKAISLTNTSSSRKYVMLVPPAVVAEETLNFGGAYEGSTKFYKGIEANNFYCVGAGQPIAVSVTGTCVNFGLPSPYENLNWSTCNLGATNGTTPQSWYGDYYAWGEVVPYYTSLTWTSATECTVDGWNTEAPLGSGGHVDDSKGYAWESYSHGSTSFKEWNVSPCAGSVPFDSDNKLKPERDAARQAWGEGWRMPTKEEWQSLYANNTFKWLAAGNTDSGTGFKAVAAGYLVVKGKSAKLDNKVYMFLPAAGYRNGTSLNFAGSYGFYWSSSLYSSNPNYAYNMDFNSGGVNPQGLNYRFYGLTARPVRAAR